MRKEIEGFPGYFIEDNGRVWSEHSNKFLKPLHDTNGYLMVNLHKDGKQYSKRIHRLVAEAFIKNPNNYDQVNHIDENKENNNINNLEWCTVSYNNNYGTHYEKCVSALKTAKRATKQVQCVETKQIFSSITEASNYYNMSRQNLHQVLNNPKRTAGGYHWIYYLEI